MSFRDGISAEIYEGLAMPELMRKVNSKDVEEDSWHSPDEGFRGFGKSISIALGREPESTDLLKRHPFDVEILRVPPGKKPYPYHSHSAQWEFYHVLSGRGISRDEDGEHRVEEGDAFLYPLREAHQLQNDDEEDLVINVGADNSVGEGAHYPDSNKWLVPLPGTKRKILSCEERDYHHGEA